MARTRRTFRSEFKTEAVKLVTEKGCSVAVRCCRLVLRAVEPNMA
jgi:hypothetical protein